jgi:hypothetical protein
MDELTKTRAMEGARSWRYGMTRRIKLLLPAALATAALAAPVAHGDSTKTCTETGTPHNNFTTTNTQTSSCNSSSDNKSSPVSVTNKGGNQPGGQQP